MSCAILLVTHPGIGHALLDTVRQLLGGHLSLPVGVIEIGYDEDIDSLLYQACHQARALPASDGVLVLTDLYGATPSNVAAQLSTHLVASRRVAGVNLPMLLRVLNYPNLALDALTAVATEAAHHGAIVDNA